MAAGSLSRRGFLGALAGAVVLVAAPRARGQDAPGIKTAPLETEPWRQTFRMVVLGCTEQWVEPVVPTNVACDRLAAAAPARPGGLPAVLTFLAELEQQMGVSRLSHGQVHNRFVIARYRPPLIDTGPPISPVAPRVARLRALGEQLRGSRAQLQVTEPPPPPAIPLLRPRTGPGPVPRLDDVVYPYDRQLVENSIELYRFVLTAEENARMVGP